MLRYRLTDVHEVIAKILGWDDPRLRHGLIAYWNKSLSQRSGIFALMAVAVPSAAASTLGLAVLEAVFLAIAALLLNALLRHLGTEAVWRAMALACFLLLNTLAMYADGGGLTELFLLGPGVASVLCWLKGKVDERPLWFFLAGASAAVGTLCKLPGLAPILAFSVFVALEVAARAKPVRVCLRTLMQLAIGFVMPWLLTATYFILHDAVGELINVSFIYPFVYGANSLATAGGLLQIARRLYVVLRPMLPLIAIVLVGFPIALLAAYRSGTRARSLTDLLQTAGDTTPGALIVIGLWAATDFAGALGGGRFHGHYFITCTASMCVVFGVSLHVLFKSSSKRARLAIMVALGVPLLVNAAADVIDSFRQRNSPSEGIASQHRVAEYLRINRTASDTLFIWEYAPLIYQRSGIRNAFRVTTSESLHDSPAVGEKFFTEIVQQWQAVPPSSVVFSRFNSPSAAIEHYERRGLALLATRYAPVHRDGGYTVYRLR